MPLGLLLTHPPQSLHFFERELQHNNYTDLTGRLNVTTAVALANTQRPPARHVSSIIPSHQVTHCSYIWQAKLYLLADVHRLFIFFSFVFCFKRKDKCVKLCGNPEMSLFFLFFFPFKHWPRYCIFFLLEKSSWLFYIVMMLMMITYLLAVQGALLPACVCMKGVLTVWPNGGGCDEDNDDDDIGSVCVIATMLNVVFLFFPLSCPWEIHEVCVRFWTLICFSQGSE